jgi:putative membrane protein
VLLVAGASYLWGVRAARRRGVEWPLTRTLLFFGLGLGSYAVVELGFLGVYSGELRWAFTTRIALLIFVVPAGVVVGRPLELAEAATGPTGAARIARLLASRLVRLFGNAMFATVFVAAIFCVFLTPLAGALRSNPLTDALLGVIVPIVGVVLVLPMAALSAVHTGLFITIEFLLAFVELLIDSVPGILLRLNDSVVDAAATTTSSLGWWPNPLHDQHLAGDMLWFIAEVADVPVLVILLLRWMRSDRREATQYDELDDDEYERLTQEHLRGGRAESA